MRDPAVTPSPLPVTLRRTIVLLSAFALAQQKGGEPMNSIDTNTRFPLLNAMSLWQGFMLDQWATTMDVMRDAASSRALTSQRPFTTTMRSTRTETPSEQVIPIAEETLQVDKQVVAGNETVVHRVVLEKPVSADVRLLTRTVTVERRKPIGTTSTGDVLTERTVRMRDTHEVPVVLKNLRVVEEIVVRQQDTYDVQTVHATVKRNDVRIEQPKHALATVSTNLPVTAKDAEAARNADKNDKSNHEPKASRQ